MNSPALTFALAEDSPELQKRAEFLCCGSKGCQAGGEFGDGICGRFAYAQTVRAECQNAADLLSKTLSSR